MICLLSLSLPCKCGYQHSVEGLQCKVIMKVIFQVMVSYSSTEGQPHLHIGVGTPACLNFGQSRKGVSNATSASVAPSSIQPSAERKKCFDTLNTLSLDAGRRNNGEQSIYINVQFSEERKTSLCLIASILYSALMSCQYKLGTPYNEACYLVNLSILFCL